MNEGGLWQIDWATNPSWQEKHKEWYCHCHLGVDPEKGKCCKSWITGVIVKEDHTHSDCAPWNKGKSFDWDKWNSENGPASTAYKCMMCGLSGQSCTSSGRCKSWPSEPSKDCNDFASNACNKKSSGLVDMDNDAKYCDYWSGECKCPSGKIGNKCQYDTSGSGDSGGGGGYGEDYLRHPVHSSTSDDHPKQSDLSDKSIGVVSSTDNAPVAEYHISESRGLIEGYKGIPPQNCDLSLNTVSDQTRCKKWWEIARNCNKEDHKFCEKLSTLGEEKCLQYPCCLWESKTHIKDPKWKNNDETIGSGDDAKTITWSTVPRSGKNFWHDTEIAPRWNNNGRCVKGNPNTGPHDKMNYVAIISSKNAENKIENDKKRQEGTTKIDENITDEKICPGCTTPEYGEDGEQIGFFRNEGSINEAKKKIYEANQHIDYYYYTEYKHRKKGGISDTDFYRYLDTRKIKMPLENDNTETKGFKNLTKEIIEKGTDRWDREYLFPDED